MQIPIARIALSLTLAVTTATSAASSYTPPTEYKSALKQIIAPSPVVMGVESTQIQPILTEDDLKARAINKVLEKYKSPMSGSSQTYINVANTHNIDWKLLPSISGVESTFGKHVPANSYNPFGWANGKKKFDNWDHSIQTVGEGISRIYTKRGLTTPQLMQPVYAPPSTTWDDKVSRFYLEFDKAYQEEKQIAQAFTTQ